MFRVRLAFTSLFIVPATLTFAVPKIAFESTTVNCGTLIEGKSQDIKAIFVMKNTGTTPLKIESVRPSCGCTVVKHDTLVAPGKSSTIESAVDIKGYRSGHFSKSITVTTNAKNEPVVRLTIEATIVSVVEISDSYLSLTKSGQQASKTVTIATAKKDFSVLSMEFQPSSVADPAAAWQAELPIPIKFQLTPTDSIRPNGYKLFKLDITNPSVTQPQSGKVVMKTNHPEKAEVVFSAYVAP